MFVDAQSQGAAMPATDEMRSWVSKTLGLALGVGDAAFSDAPPNWGFPVGPDAEQETRGIDSLTLSTEELKKAIGVLLEKIGERLTEDDTVERGNHYIYW